MRVNQTYTVDIISITPEGKVVLTICDHHAWNDACHLPLLQNEINSYLQFITSGQLLDDYPNATGRELIIDIVMKFEPNEEGTSFLKKAKEVVTTTGIGLQWARMKPDN